MVRIGIIGAGRMGNCHAGNLAKLKNACLSAVYDINPEKTAAFVKTYPTAKICKSAKELVESPDVDLVVITSPTYCHPEGIKLAMATDKPIFCEKPLCRTEADLKKLIPMIRNYKNMFAIGFVRRYSAGAIMMKKMLEEGKLGKLICGSIQCTFGGFKREWGDWFADYEKSGGVMLDMLAHHCDLQNCFIGQPESIYAKALMLDKKSPKPYDYVSATAVFKNGYFSNMECSWLRSGPGDTYMVVHGEKGSLKLSDREGLLFYEPGKEPEKIKLDDAAITGHLQETVGGDMYANEMSVIVDCVENHKKPYAVGEDGIAAMKFCLGMIKSAETGKVVKFK